MYDILEVNFYGETIHLASRDGGKPYASIEEILTQLNLKIEDYEWAATDPRLDIEIMTSEDGRETPIITLDSLNGFLFLINPSDVAEDFQEKYLRYARTCTKALSEFWVKGAAINRHVTPYNVGSQFNDFRAKSRPELVEACAAYAEHVGEDPDDVFNKAMKVCYSCSGMTPKAEDEELTGTAAMHLASAEFTYAKTLRHCIAWGKKPEGMAEKDITEYFEHLGSSFLTIRNTVPASMYRN